jgi:hypothetical protein
MATKTPINAYYQMFGKRIADLIFADPSKQVMIELGSPRFNQFIGCPNLREQAFVEAKVGMTLADWLATPAVKRLNPSKRWLVGCLAKGWFRLAVQD